MTLLRRKHKEQSNQKSNNRLKVFVKRRLIEGCGLGFLFLCIFLTLSLFSFSSLDPSFGYAATRSSVNNILGFLGSYTAGFLLETFGICAFYFPIYALANSIAFFKKKEHVYFFLRFIGFILSLVLLDSLFNTFKAPIFWPFQDVGMGGSLGFLLHTVLLSALNSFGFQHSFFSAIVRSFFVLLSTFLGFTFFFFSIHMQFRWFFLKIVNSVRFVIFVVRDQFAYHENTHGVPTHKIRRLFYDFSFQDKGHDCPEPGLASSSKSFDSLDSRTFSFLPFLRRCAVKITYPLYYGFKKSKDMLTVPVFNSEESLLPSNDLNDLHDCHSSNKNNEHNTIQNAIVDEKKEAEHQPRSNDPRVYSKEKRQRAGPYNEYNKSGDTNSYFVQNAVFDFPSLNLLSEHKEQLANTEDTQQVALIQEKLEKTLKEFGIRGNIVQASVGPVVTLYELEPAPGVKSSRVISLADDIARSMSVLSARIAIIPGRNAIGIELPNTKRQLVFLKEILNTSAYQNPALNIPLALGKDIAGSPVVADLAKMPHLLIAGTTGSGKSVCINTIILSVLYSFDPDSCKLLLIDPKMLELSVYDNIPHLLTPVITEPKKAVVALKWVVREMEKRYKLMAECGVRNINSYNERVYKQKKDSGIEDLQKVQSQNGKDVIENADDSNNGYLFMPYIVVVIDEMADLMMVAGKEIESAVQRLAQMARAAGIHLITATQRPSVDVITGTIKANFPTRISFQVTSKIDSRTILGEQGAEQLLGQGDMLYMFGGGRTKRVHAPLVRDTEVELVVQHLKQQGKPHHINDVVSDTEENDNTNKKEKNSYGSSSYDDKNNELFKRAVDIVLRDKRATTSYIQRRMRVGYNTAARLMEMMEDKKIVSAPNHQGKREILIKGEQDDIKPPMASEEEAIYH